jgi:hypothetical protein
MDSPLAATLHLLAVAKKTTWAGDISQQHLELSPLSCSFAVSFYFTFMNHPNSSFLTVDRRRLLPPCKLLPIRMRARLGLQ